jgi:hypothetical protein
MMSYYSVSPRWSHGASLTSLRRVRFTCCPPLAAMLNCKAKVFRESFLTRTNGRMQSQIDESFLALTNLKWRVKAALKKGKRLSVSSILDERP